MERFFWREVAGRRADSRFPAEVNEERIRGYDAWRQLVGDLSDIRPDASADAWRGAFDTFLAALDEEARSSAPNPTCCLFISHRMNDVNNALHIAHIATLAGYDYWLDIHDPALIAMRGFQMPSPAKDILIAAIIEMALLNVTHVIALHTQHSAGSKWIPYELGRAKARLVHSDQAAGWFDRRTPVTSCGEYVYLAQQTWTEDDIRNWLSRTHHDRCAKSRDTTWPYGDVPPLDA